MPVDPKYSNSSIVFPTSTPTPQSQIQTQTQTRYAKQWSVKYTLSANYTQFPVDTAFSFADVPMDTIVYNTYQALGAVVYDLDPGFESTFGYDGIKCTVPQSGIYHLFSSMASTSDLDGGLYYFVNNTQRAANGFATTGWQASGAAELFLEKGDIVRYLWGGSFSAHTVVTVVAGEDATYFSIRYMGPG